MIWLGTTRTGERFELPEEITTRTAAILAKKGAGKTYLAGVLEEEFAKAGIAFVVLDPIGAHHGIRSKADGKTPAYPIVVFGGEFADIEIGREDGEKVATAIVEENISAIVDVSQLSKTAWRIFVRDFARTLYAINRTPRHVLIEEATEFVPQRLRPDLTEVYEAVEKLVRMGRGRGLGVTLISQRSAQVAKDVLTQIDILFALRTVGKQDRDAVLAMFDAVLEADQQTDLYEFRSTLPSLPDGTAWVWAPESHIFTQVRIRTRETYHAGATPTFETERQVVQARPDVSRLRERFASQAPAPTTTDANGITAEKVRALEYRVTQLVKDADRFRLDRDAWKKKHDDLAFSTETWKKAVDLIRQAFSMIFDSTLPTIGIMPVDQERLEEIVREIVPRMIPVAVGGPVEVPPAAVIRKSYQRQAVDRIMKRVVELGPDEREALRFLLGHDVYVTINRIAIGISGNDAGGTRDRWAKAIKSLVEAGLVVKDRGGRNSYKPAIREHVKAALSAHNPAEDEVEEVYTAVLAKVAA